MARKETDSIDQKLDQGTKIGLVFAADLGGTHLRAAALSCDGTILRRQKQETPRTDKPDEIVCAFIDIAREYQNDFDAIRMISVAVPGTVDIEKGIVVKAPNLPALDGFDLVPALERELKVPAMLENDAGLLGAARLAFDRLL